MRVNIKLIALFIVFLLFYGSLNSYVVLRLGVLLGIEMNILYWCIALVTLSLPLAMCVERIFPNIVSRAFYTVSSLWMGIFLFSLCLLLIYEVIRPFYTVPYAGIIIISLVGMLTFISMINAVGVVVKEVEIPIENLKKEVKIVQLSDIHMGTIRNSRFLEKIVRKTNDLDSDIIMITGDMIDGIARLHKDMFNVFNKVRAKTYFVTGNHEVYEGTEGIYELFKDTSINVLKNEIVNYEGIQIVGIEYSQDKNHLKRELEKMKIDKAYPAVLMHHVPRGFDDAKNAGINLQISGHTHHGQLMPLNLFARMIFRYSKGLHDIEGMFLYVNPGTGTWGPFMRLGSRNEITLLKLVNEQR